MSTTPSLPTLRPFKLPIAQHNRASESAAGLHMRTWLRWLLLLLLFATQTVQAQQPPRITAGELAILPVYCPYTQTFEHDPRGPNPTPETAKWVRTFGKTFWAMHHYCWALIRNHRAGSAMHTRLAKQSLWEGAISDFNYVIENGTSDFVLLPEIYQRIGETYLLMGSPGNAVLAFDRSRALKPDYWPPYVSWADALVKLGKKAEAKRHLETGLRVMPRSAPLSVAYRKVGGDVDLFLKSLPAAVASAEVSASTATSSPDLPREAPAAASAASSAAIAPTR